MAAAEIATGHGYFLGGAVASLSSAAGSSPAEAQAAHRDMAAGNSLAAGIYSRWGRIVDKRRRRVGVGSRIQGPLRGPAPPRPKPAQHQPHVPPPCHPPPGAIHLRRAKPPPPPCHPPPAPCQLFAMTAVAAPLAFMVSARMRDMMVVPPLLLQSSRYRLPRPTTSAPNTPALGSRHAAGAGPRKSMLGHLQAWSFRAGFMTLRRVCS